MIQEMLEQLSSYLRVEISGLENIPKEGAFICAPNHSGFVGLDAVILGYQIKKNANRKPHLLAHKLWFSNSLFQKFGENFSLIRADFSSALNTLKQKEGIVWFPEGESGNFKPTNRRYRLQHFKGGFVRAAIVTGCPVIPVTIVGAEETHINLGRFSGLRKIIGTDIPLPLNLIPLPIQWQIQFHTPVHFEGTKDEALNEKKVEKLAKKFRHELQRKILEAIRERNALKFGNLGFSDDDLP